MLLIDNKDLFYSTQNCIQYCVISCNGKNLKMKMCVCVCAYTQLMAKIQACQLHECTYLHKCDSYINSPLYLILLS